MMLDKPRRIVNKKAVDRVRSIGYCEYCGSRAGLQVHHIKSRGARGDDVDSNLVLLCYVCHGRAHEAKISREKLREIVGRREYDVDSVS